MIMVFNSKRLVLFFAFYMFYNYLMCQNEYFIDRILIDLAINDNYYDSVKTDTIYEKNFIRYLYYDESGKVRKLIRFNLNNRKLLSVDNIDEKGELKGIQLFFYESGRLKELSVCNNGCVTFNFYENQRLKKFYTVDSLYIPIDYAANFCENGQLKSELITDSIKQYYTEYYCRLTKKKEGVFKLVKYYDVGYDLKPTGIWKEYDVNGKVINVFNKTQLNASISSNKNSERINIDIKEVAKPLIGSNNLSEFIIKNTSICSDSTLYPFFYVRAYIDKDGQAGDIHFMIKKDGELKKISQPKQFNNSQKEIYNLIKKIKWKPAKTEEGNCIGTYIQIPIKCNRNK